MKYSFITQHKNTYPIRLMCQVLGVSRNGYYSFQSSKARDVEPVHLEMLEWIQDIGESSKFSYGSGRMKRALNVLGYPVSRQKTRRLMKEAGVQARHRKKYKVTTNSKHKQPVFENLVARKFDVDVKDTWKAWLFATSVDGAKASANLYSLVETAKANGHEPHSYVQHVLTKLPAALSLEDIEALMPFNFKPEQCQAA